MTFDDAERPELHLSSLRWAWVLKVGKLGFQRIAVLLFLAGYAHQNDGLFLHDLKTFY
jgi:hypothetical protein